MTDYRNDTADRALNGRAARLALQTAVLMSRRGDAWQTDLVDISATGVRLARPARWQGQAGEIWVIDLLASRAASIHVMAEVVRVGADSIAFAFTQIPDDTQQQLWALLGRCADATEPWADDGSTG